MAYDLRDRVTEVVLTSRDRESRLKRSSAGYDNRTGELATVCQFQDSAAGNDPCKDLEYIPVQASALEQARKARVAQHLYERDDRGNLIRYVTPVNADGFFVVKRFSFDGVMSLVEVQERTDYCRVAVDGEPKGGCLGGASSRYGTYQSWSEDIDWRQAVATTECDINRNGMHRDLDPAGRIVSVSASWNVEPGKAPLKCVSPDNSNSSSWPPLARYQYRLPARPQDIAWIAPKVRVTRTVDGRLYKFANDPSVLTGKRDLVSEIFVDQLGRDVLSLAESDICIPGTETPDGATCISRSRFTLSGLTTFDALDRPLSNHLPVAMADLLPIDQSTIASLPSANVSSSRTILDGFDRPLSVRLPDGNGYGFSYGIAEIGANSMVHRTVMRDARCIPSATDRDLRGNITAVHELAHKGNGNGYGKHSTGSSYDPSAFATIEANGWVKRVAVTSGQQVMTCSEGDPDNTGLITTPLSDPLVNQIAGLARLTATYRYDQLNRLIAVELPPEEGLSAAVTQVESAHKIQVAYDGLSRRVAIADPDRGFDFLSYDLASNVVCKRSGPRVSAGRSFEEALASFQREALRTQAGGARADGEDLCLAPSANPVVDRTIRQLFDYDRMTAVQYVAPTPTDGGRKNVNFEFGNAEDINENRAGRQTRIRDVTGESRTLRYSEIGLPALTLRRFAALLRKGYSSNDTPIGEIREENLYDSWGVLSRTTLTGVVNSIRSDGSNDTAANRQLNVKQSTWYRYSPAGQVAEILVGESCTRPQDQQSEWTTGTPDCRDVVPPVRFLADAAFDERGNPLRLEYGHGVVTRDTFDPDSNRLRSSSSRIGVPCIEFGPDDDCSKTSPPILFQNVDYEYDAAGLLTSYLNSPKYADPCAGGDCPAITTQHAAIQGLLITNSANRFAYDEVGRLKLSKRAVASFDREASYRRFGDDELRSMRPSQFEINEEFQFSDNHLLKGLRRTVKTGWAGGGLASPQTTSIQHVYSGGRPNAPDRTTIVKPQEPYSERQTFDQDSRGRLSNVDCSGCLRQKPEIALSISSRELVWDPDDTMAQGLFQTEPTEPQNTPDRRKTGYFNEVTQSYDFLGNRVIKRSRALKIRASGHQEKADLSETVYFDERLSVTRQPGKVPEALYHILNGPRKMGSKWIGGEGIFSYHAQISTQSISDVVYARGDDPTTARIHKQLEYAPFGEVLIGREATIVEATRDPKGRSRLAQPEFRFDGKEYDRESGLSYFGARFYDQRLGLWLSPDPANDLYLRGELAGGIYKAQNLGAYTFAWGDPVNHFDVHGYYPAYAADHAQQIGSIDEVVTEINNMRVIGPDHQVISNIGRLKGRDAHLALVSLGQVNTPKPSPLNKILVDPNSKRFVKTKEGEIDVAHFLFHAGRGARPSSYADKIGHILVTKVEGFATELWQGAFKNTRHSAFSDEDLPSNQRGQDFGSFEFDPKSDQTLGEQVKSYFNKYLIDPEQR